MPVTTDRIQASVLSGFDDPIISAPRWSELLRHGDTDGVNLTWQWQRCWWEAFGRGRLLLIAVHRNRELVAIAPLFADAGMIFNLCPEDRLDFVGDVSDFRVLDSILRIARESVENFLGFRFYFIPDDSRTGQGLRQAAERTGLNCFQEDRLACPWLDIKHHADTAEQATRKKSLLRHERYFQRNGDLQIHVWTDTEDVLPLLDDFFRQHISRRSTTPDPSLFEQPRQREYYRQLTIVAAQQGWLRFAQVSWNSQAIAYHFGLSYRGRYLWGIPSFEIDLAAHSPGEVLLRQVLLDAIREGAAHFDFGPGDEAYKSRFATDVTQLETWGLYPALATQGAYKCEYS